MRLLSWNINGIRTLPLYHPWNTLKTLDNILKELKADVICFQEMKCTRANLERHVAVPAPFDAFFSFPVTKGGYSGVGVFTNSDVVVPLKAEEGLSGRIQPKPPLAPEERISPAYPLAHHIDLVPDEEGKVPQDLGELDKEGRALMLDFGLFVLINVYCPNETSDARLPYKMNFHLLLEERVRKLIEEEHREVIVVGDINICAAPIDHCEGNLPGRAEEFWVHPAREWLRKWLAPLGPMHDVIRERWPDRKGMYTCWNQKIGARATNYGTRIDYFLLTKGLLPWFKDGDIQPSVKGSDHCPIFIDLHDEITTESGVTVTLAEALRMTDAPREAPRICAKYWDEFSHKQKLLSSFFGKKSDVAVAQEKVGGKLQELGGVHQAKSQVHATQKPEEAREKSVELLSPPLSLNDRVPDTAKSKETDITQEKELGHKPTTQNKPSDASGKRKMHADSNYPPQKTKKAKKGKGAVKVEQAKLSAFFATAGPGPSSSQSQPEASGEPDCMQDDANDLVELEPEVATFLLSQSSSLSPQAQATKEDSKKHWSQLFAKVEAPRCNVHNEPAVEYTVNKQGPNKGKKFYLCSRPVGPGYDAGRSVRPREEVDPQYRCNFFKWSSEVKQTALREAKRKSQPR